MIWEKMLTQPVASASGYTPNAVKFDGANDYLTRGGDLTGIADSKSGIFSAWVRLDGGDGVEIRLLNLYSSSSPPNPAFIVQRQIDNTFRFRGKKSDGTAILELITGNKFLAGAKWLHLLASWDLAANVSSIYVSDVSSQTVVIRTNDTLDYLTVGANWSVGADSVGGYKFNGALSDLYFAPGQYLDFSVEANRRKFIDASGRPVDLGATGSTPTGDPPAIFLKGNSSGFGVNSGSGGNFTVNGALEKASSTPVTAAVNAVDFDGTSSYLVKSTDLTGVADGKSGIFSGWVRVDEPPGGTRFVLSNTSQFFAVGIDSNQKVQVVGFTAGSVKILEMLTTTTHPPSPNWMHVLASWDLATSSSNLYLNGSNVLAGGATLTNDTIDYVRGAWAVANNTSGTNYADLAASELYFAPNQYLDLSVQANREKFIKDGKPVSLGATGSLPTGTAPAIYLPNRAALVGTNAGSGGNFNINGAPKDANSTPLYYYAEPVRFDGTNDNLTRGANLTGIANGPRGTVSFWFRLDGGDGTNMRVLADAASNGLFQVVRNTSNKFTITGFKETTYDNILSLTSTATYTSSQTWMHFLAQWDTSTGVAYMYINNASALAGGAIVNAGNIDFTFSNNYGVGGQTNGTQRWNGCLTELWFSTAVGPTQLDISQSANRAKFIDQTTLRPVPLGAKGELPTGSPPLLYLGRDFSNFQTNLGSGGNFTVTGALERGTTSPSDVQA
jgi:hypothetical protein